MNAGIVDPSTFTKNISDQAGQNYDFWKNNLGSGDFSAPYRSTPDAGQYFQPASEKNNQFLQGQATALGGLVGSGGGLNVPQALDRSNNNFDINQNQTQNKMGLGNYMENLGIGEKNALTSIGNNFDVGSADQAFDQTQQTAQAQAMMEMYQEMMKEQAIQKGANQQAMDALFSAGGNLAGSELSSLFPSGGSSGGSPYFASVPTMDQIYNSMYGTGAPSNFGLSLTGTPQPEFSLGG